MIHQMCRSVKGLCIGGCPHLPAGIRFKPAVPRRLRVHLPSGVAHTWPSARAPRTLWRIIRRGANARLGRPRLLQGGLCTPNDRHAWCLPAGRPTRHLVGGKRPGSVPVHLRTALAFSLAVSRSMLRETAPDCHPGSQGVRFLGVGRRGRRPTPEKRIPSGLVPLGAYRGAR
jgi:hypothetical protein